MSHPQEPVEMVGSAALSWEAFRRHRRIFLESREVAWLETLWRVSPPRAPDDEGLEQREWTVFSY